MESIDQSETAKCGSTIQGYLFKRASVRNFVICVSTMCSSLSSSRTCPHPLRASAFTVFGYLLLFSVLGCLCSPSPSDLCPSLGFSELHQEAAHCDASDVSEDAENWIGASETAQSATNQSGNEDGDHSWQLREWMGTLSKEVVKALFSFPLVLAFGLIPLLSRGIEHLWLGELEHMPFGEAKGLYVGGLYLLSLGLIKLLVGAPGLLSWAYKVLYLTYGLLSYPSGEESTPLYGEEIAPPLGEEIAPPLAKEFAILLSGVISLLLAGVIALLLTGVFALLAPVLMELLSAVIAVLTPVFVRLFVELPRRLFLEAKRGLLAATRLLLATTRLLLLLAARLLPFLSTTTLLSFVLVLLLFYVVVLLLFFWTCWALKAFFMWFVRHLLWAFSFVLFWVLFWLLGWLWLLWASGWLLWASGWLLWAFGRLHPEVRRVLLWKFGLVAARESARRSFFWAEFGVMLFCPLGLSVSWHLGLLMSWQFGLLLFWDFSRLLFRGYEILLEDFPQLFSPKVVLVWCWESALQVLWDCFGLLYYGFGQLIAGFGQLVAGFGRLLNGFGDLVFRPFGDMFREFADACVWLDERLGRGQNRMSTEVEGCVNWVAEVLLGLQNGEGFYLWCWTFGAISPFGLGLLWQYGLLFWAFRPLCWAFGLVVLIGFGRLSWQYGQGFWVFLLFVFFGTVVLSLFLAVALSLWAFGRLFTSFGHVFTSFGGVFTRFGRLF